MKGSPKVQPSQVTLVDECTVRGFDYDLFIIGGGAGSLALAKEASNLGARVCIAESEQKWGTDISVVRAFHYAALSGDNIPNQIEAGWVHSEKPGHNWKLVQQHITKLTKSIYRSYVDELQRYKVDNFHCSVSFEDSHTLLLQFPDGKSKSVYANFIVIAVGCVQSTDEVGSFADLTNPCENLYMLEKPPGKTLIVGGSAQAVEYAGILTSLGFNVTLLVRNVLLRGYDQDMVKRIEAQIINHGVNIIKKALLVDLKRQENGKIKAKFQPPKTGPSIEDEFDTVLLAGNKNGATANLKINKAGLKPIIGGKIKVNDLDQTTVQNIFAIGDVAQNRPDSTMVTIKTGQLLAQRLFGINAEKMKFNTVPTILLSPIEYGFCGCTEEEALKQYGNDKVEVYHTSFTPLEWELLGKKKEDMCYTKLIITKDDDLVRGYHYIGPNAGEIVQGFSIGLLFGATKSQWDKSVGIHPTCAEVLIGLKYTKSTNPVVKKTAC